MGYNLLDAYDDAQEDERNTGFTAFYGHHIGIAAECGHVRVWLTRDTNVVGRFEVDDRSPHTFLNAVETFLDEQA